MLSALRNLAENTIQNSMKVLIRSLPFENKLTTEEYFVEPTLAGANGETVEIDDIAARARGVMIIGAPGSGKTTLLRFLANRQATDFLAGKQQRCPLFIPATQLHASTAKNTDLPTLVATVMLNTFSGHDLENVIAGSCRSAIRVRP